MKIITKKIEGNFEAWTVASSINTCINISSKVDEYKKLFKINKSPKENTLEWELYKQKGCLLASPNEILDWLKEHNPTDKRLKGHIPCKYDDDKILWCVMWSEFLKIWKLTPMRHMGKRTK